MHAAILGRRTGVCGGSGRGPNSDLVHQTLEGGSQGFPASFWTLTSGPAIVHARNSCKRAYVSPALFVHFIHHIQGGRARDLFLSGHYFCFFVRGDISNCFFMQTCDFSLYLSFFRCLLALYLYRRSETRNMDRIPVISSNPFSFWSTVGRNSVRRET